jgi:CelD/BcsL family acetyltransferase involved in cellulose biosynthesis
MIERQRGLHGQRGRSLRFVHAAILALEDLSPRDIEEWRMLAAQAAEPNPFFEPEYVLPAAEFIGGLALLVVRASDGWSACLPIHRPRRWHRIPARAVATWQHKYCFLGTPLVRADCVESAVDTMTRELMRQRTAAFVGFDSFIGEGPLLDALRASIEDEGGEGVQVDAHERAALRRRATAHDYVTLKAKHRHELARKRRRLEDELGAGLLTVDRAEEAEAVDDFLELEASGWKGRGGTALASVELDAQFFRTVCRSFRGLGRLRLLSLQANGERVAMACNVRAGDGVFCLKIAFDERWRRYSPGAQLMLDHVSWFHQEESATWMDSCVQPSNELLNRLWPDRRRIVTLALPANSPPGRIARTVIIGAVRWRDQRSGAQDAPSPHSTRV